MSNRDYLERNMERLLRAVQPELELPEDKKQEILASLTAEAQTPSHKDSTDSSLTVIFRHPATSAAAALLLMAILAGVAWLWRLSTEQTTQSVTRPENTFEETSPQEQQPVDELVAEGINSKKVQIQLRLRQVTAMYEAGNIRGLKTMLSDEAEEVRTEAANYLALIGDFNAVEPLLNASKDWTGSDEDNPFVGAIYQIMLRISQQQAKVAVEEEQQEPNEPLGTAPPTPTAKKPPKPEKETVTYSGIVTNESGQPVQNVYVRSIWYNEYMQFSGTEAEGWTDEDGLFTVGPIDASNLDKIDRTLIFDHPDYAIGWFQTKRAGQAMPQDGVEVNLLSPSVVSGIVLDEQGDPVEDALVEANLQLQLQPNERYYYLTMDENYGLASITDSEGQFAFDNIPDKARLHIDVRHSDYAHYSTRFGYSADDYPVRAGQDDLLITLKPGGFIRGRLLMNGESYEKQGITILVQGENGSALSRTDRTGKFETTGLSRGSYTVKAIDDEFEKKGLVTPTLTNVMVEVGQEPTEVELVLGGGLPLTVSVIDEQTNKPANDVRVTAAPQGARNITVADGRTNAQGLCILKVGTGQYVIKAQGWKYGKLHDFSENVTVSQSDKDVIVEIAITPRQMISGLLIDDTGRPVEGAVSLGSDSAIADTNGKFELPEPWGDEMEVHIGFAFDETTRIGQAFLWQKSDDVYDLVLMLEPAATVIGRIVDENGAPVEQAEPELLISMPNGQMRPGGRNNPWKLNISGEGEFEFENVPAGLEMDVLAEIPGFGGTASVARLIPGQTTDIGNLVLKPLAGFENGQTEWTGELKGRVFDENNEPMVGLRVNANIGTQHFTDVTDIEGKYTLTGLPRGKNISGSVYAPGYGHTMFKAVVDSNDLDIQIFPQGWELLNKEAPGLFVQKWFNTEPLILEQYRGKVVLLQVGVFLPNYSQDLDLSQKTIDKYGDKGLEVIAIHQPLDVTRPREVTEADIADYITRHNIIYPFGIDENSSGNGTTYSLYDVKATPALYLVDKNGILRTSPKRNELDRWIDRLLAE